MANSKTSSNNMLSYSHRPLSNHNAHKLQDLSIMPGGTSSSRESGYFSEYSPSSITSSLPRITESQINIEETLDVDRPLQQSAPCQDMTQFPFHPETSIDIDSLIKEVYDEFGICWRELGRYLLHKECTVENIAADYEKVSERSYQVLLTWKREQGQQATINELFSALINIGKDKVAQRLLTYLPLSLAKCLSGTVLSHVKTPRSAQTASLPNIALVIPEQLRDLEVERKVKCGPHSQVYVCHSHASNKRYVLRQVSKADCGGTPSGGGFCIWAARKAVSSQELHRSMKNLRKTNELVKELQLKQSTILKLKDIIETLQGHLKTRQVIFCPKDQKCQECDKTNLKQELILKELELLHYELVNMASSNRRLSISGIPTERIYNLAERAYNVCEEHKMMHEKFKTLRRRYSQELLEAADNRGKATEGGSSGPAGRRIKELRRKCSQELVDIDTDSSDDLAEEIEGPLQCTLNILLTFGRRRKSTQSMKQRKRKPSKKVQRNMSDKSMSRWYVPSLRDNYLEAVENQSLLTTWPLREEWRLPELEKLKEYDNDIELRTAMRSKASTLPSTSSAKPLPQESREGVTATSADHLPGYRASRNHVRSNTFPSSLSRHPGYSFEGPEDLQLDDIDDVGSSFGSVRSHRCGFILGDEGLGHETYYALTQSSPLLNSENHPHAERDGSRRASDHRPPLRDRLEYDSRERCRSFHVERDGDDELTMRSAVSDSMLQSNKGFADRQRRCGITSRSGSPLEVIEWAKDIDLADVICV